MTERLMHSTRHPLRFCEDGRLRVLQISDIQETLAYDQRTLRDLDRLMDAAKPDFVILGGDNFNGHVIKTEDELSAYLDIFTAPMESRQIPWAHVFGNHDHDCDVDDLRMAELFEAYPHCISSHTAGIGGTTNFVIPVMSRDGSRIAWNIWGLDSGNRVDLSAPETLGLALKLPRRSQNSDCWDLVRFDQLMWYWNRSLELERQNGGVIPGLMFMHIAPWEFQWVVDNPDETGCTGSTVEHMNLGALNSGIIAAVLQRGDIRAISCGHSHEDCFEGELCGIRVSLDACAGYSPYGIDSLRGGRLFVIGEDGSLETRMLHYKDL